MTAQELVEKLETAIYDAKVNAATAALIEIFNDGVKRGRVERGNEINVEQLQKEITRLTASRDHYRNLEKRNGDLANERQVIINRLDDTIIRQRADIEDLRNTAKMNLHRGDKLQDTLRAERRLWEEEKTELQRRIEQLTGVAEKELETTAAIKIANLEQENERLRKNLDAIAKGVTIALREDILLGPIMQMKPNLPPNSD